MCFKELFEYINTRCMIVADKNICREFTIKSNQIYMVCTITSNEYHQFDFREFHGLPKELKHSIISKVLWNVHIDFRYLPKVYFFYRNEKIDWIAVDSSCNSGSFQTGKKATESINLNINRIRCS